MSQDTSSEAPMEGPFRDYEESRGAVFGELEGWSVAAAFPSSSGRINPGLAAARGAAAIVDLTPLGRLKVTGRDRTGLLQRISMNDLRPLEAGRFVPTLFGTAKGRIVDRALVLDRGESLLLVTAPGGRQRLQAWIRKYALSEDVRVTDISAETGAFGVTGPIAPEVVRNMAGIGTGGLEPGRFLSLPVEGVDAIVAPFDMLPAAWIVLAEQPGIVTVHGAAVRSGEPLGLLPIGVREAEILRIEAGIPADGHELTEEFNPWEVGLESSFSLSKGCYTGQEVIARLKTYDKVQRRLVGLRLGGAAPPAVPQTVRAARESGEETEIGTLTSAVSSERLGETIGLGCVRLAFQAAGTEVVIGDERLPATVAALPFEA